MAYSCRNALEGSMCAARRAGMLAAIAAMRSRIEEKLDSVVEAVGTIQTDLTNTKERVDKLEQSAAR